MSVIAIYQTDAWHSYASRELVAIATSEKNRDILVKRYLKNYLYNKPDKETLEQAIKQIKETGQTDCLTSPCDMEIDTEIYDTNTILQ